MAALFYGNIWAANKKEYASLWLHSNGKAGNDQRSYYRVTTRFSLNYNYACDFPAGIRDFSEIGAILTRLSLLVLAKQLPEQNPISWIAGNPYGVSCTRPSDAPPFCRPKALIIMTGIQLRRRFAAEDNHNKTCLFVLFPIKHEWSFFTSQGSKYTKKP